MSVKPIFEKKNILVTGGAGFIGSHLCDELVKHNKVICVDNFVSGDESNIDHLLQNPDFEFIRHDVNEPLRLEDFRELEKFRVSFQGIQEIYHLACPTSPKNFEKNIALTAVTNSVGVKNILDLAIRYKAKFLLTSSSVVYGPRNDVSPYFPETYIGKVDFLSPRACYDEGKRFAETITMAYHTVYGLDTKIARIFRTYGSRMKLNDGQMLPDFVSDALENKNLTIYGDQSFSSSFCHVKDIVAGLLKLMESQEFGPINLGSDEEMRIIDVAKKVIAMTGSSSQIMFEKPLLFMTPLGLPETTLAKERLSWFPVVLLDQGIQEALDYFKAHKKIIRPGNRFKFF